MTNDRAAIILADALAAVLPHVGDKYLRAIGTDALRKCGWRKTADELTVITLPNDQYSEV